MEKFRIKRRTRIQNFLFTKALGISLYFGIDIELLDGGYDLTQKNPPE